MKSDGEGIFEFKRRHLFSVKTEGKHFKCCIWQLKKPLILKTVSMLCIAL